MYFEWALTELKKGSWVARKGWKNVTGIHLQRPDEHSKMTLPYIYTKTTKGDLVPWLASQTDILAVDWELVNN